MAAPTIVFSRVFDPSDVDAVKLLIGRSSDEKDPLKPGEKIAAFTLLPNTVATVAGLILPSDDARKPTITDTADAIPPELRFWFSIDPAKVTATTFNVEQTLWVELTVDTDSVPPRRRQITLGLKVQNQ